MNTIPNYIWSIVGIVISVIAALYTRNKGQINKLKAKNEFAGTAADVIGQLAVYVVAGQEAAGGDGATKKLNALNELMEQAKKLGLPITQPMASGAIEKAVANKPVINKPIVNKPIAPVKPVAVAEPAVDDLKVEDLRTENNDQ